MQLTRVHTLVQDAMLDKDISCRHLRNIKQNRSFQLVIFLFNKQKLGFNYVNLLRCFRHWSDLIPFLDSVLGVQQKACERVTGRLNVQFESTPEALLIYPANILFRHAYSTGCWIGVVWLKALQIFWRCFFSFKEPANEWQTTKWDTDSVADLPAVKDCLPVS